MEQQLRVQSSALEAAVNGIILTDTAGKILFANKAYCAMTGHDLEEVPGQTTRFIESDKCEADFSRELWKPSWPDGSGTRVNQPAQRWNPLQ